MNWLTMIRKRIIPWEEVDISRDEVLFFNGDTLITRWIPIRQRMDVGWGISYLNSKEHYKISAFHDTRGDFSYWYCDVVEATFYPEEQKLVMLDLLVDVVYYPGEAPRILDLDELEIALKQGWITEEQEKIALQTAENILHSIQRNEFPPEQGIWETDPPASFRIAATV